MFGHSLPCMCGQQLMSVSVSGSVPTIVMTMHGDLLTVKCYLFKFDSALLEVMLAFLPIF